jgi:PelA/Pel-15E family pectate lyase
MVGAAFDYHPPSQEVTLRPVDADHPLVAAFRGRSPFIHRDEPYCFKGAYEKFEFRPLLSMDTENLKDPRGRVGEIPRYVAWIKPHGRGRVFYCSPSHYPESYESATVLKFLLDGVQYAAGDLKCDDSPLGQDRRDRRAKSGTKAPREAENVLIYQRDSGGWPKNYDRRRTLSSGERAAILKDRSKNDAIIDNGATHTEIRIVADAFGKTGDVRFKDAALRGIRYLLAGQYENGGWPQRFPDPRGYARHITFNDNAMIGVMRLLRDAARSKEPFSFVPADIRTRCRRAVERGIQCILKCQVRVRGRRTVWCAQHDEVTLEPRKARSYELASLSGSESVGIVRFLMEIEDPDEEVIGAIEDAVAWFKRARLDGIRVVRVKDEKAPRGYDKVVVEDPEAPPLWARFYNIETNRPIFCSRDGIPRRTLAEISYERRNGYSWLGHYAEDLLEKDLPAWRQRTGRG